MPRRRKGVDWGIAVKYTRRRLAAENGVEVEESKENLLVNLDSVKQLLNEIEVLYSNTMGNLDREWDTPEKREKAL